MEKIPNLKKMKMENNNNKMVNSRMKRINQKKNKIKIKVYMMGKYPMKNLKNMEKIPNRNQNQKKK